MHAIYQYICKACMLWSNCIRIYDCVECRFVGNKMNWIFHEVFGIWCWISNFFSHGRSLTLVGSFVVQLLRPDIAITIINNRFLFHIFTCFCFRNVVRLDAVWEIYRYISHKFDTHQKKNNQKPRCKGAWQRATLACKHSGNWHAFLMDSKWYGIVFAISKTTSEYNMWRWQEDYSYVCRKMSQLPYQALFGGLDPCTEEVADTRFLFMLLVPQIKVFRWFARWRCGYYYILFWLLWPHLWRAVDIIWMKWGTQSISYFTISKSRKV